MTCRQIARASRQRALVPTAAMKVFEHARAPVAITHVYRRALTRKHTQTLAGEETRGKLLQRHKKEWKSLRARYMCVDVFRYK